MKEGGWGKLLSVHIIQTTYRIVNANWKTSLSPSLWMSLKLTSTNGPDPSQNGTLRPSE